MEFLKFFNIAISIIFMICYSYQFFYIFVILLHKHKSKNLQSDDKNSIYLYDSHYNDNEKKQFLKSSVFKGPFEHKPTAYHKYAVLICARNEENVISHLIDSIKCQDYPQHLITTFVVADNCTDNTAQIAENSGANVYIRTNKNLIGKGYALDFLLGKIKDDMGENAFDGYFVFDADNVLCEDYISNMNKTFCNGYDIVTSYRNSKNYGENWITAGYGLWFLRESVYLNYARYTLGTSCGVSGTGFMFSSKILKKTNGCWPFHLLTEDIEFSAVNIIDGVKIGYCNEAEFFDEQPVTFTQSRQQRLRWAKGYFQVFAKHGKGLVSGVIKNHDFSCYDMAMNLMPAAILTLVSIIVNCFVSTCEIVAGNDITFLLSIIAGSLLSVYQLFFLIGTITTITEWKNIHTAWYKKIFYTFTFPLFMLTYIPISLAALFCNVTWQPIHHSDSKSLAAIRRTK